MGLGFCRYFATPQITEIFVRKLLWLLLFLFSSGAASAGKLTIDWRFTHVNPGFDHPCKLVVYIDGKRISESKAYKQSQKGILNLEVSEGKHTLKIIALTQYKGNWEDHTVKNNYSMDAIVSTKHTFGAEQQLHITWDLANKKTSFYWGKPTPKQEKIKQVTLKLEIAFEGINDGQDHTCRLVVYLDGQQYAVSPSYKESKGLQFSITFPEGQHRITLQNEVQFNGTWQEQTLENNYTLDARYTINQQFTKSENLTLLFHLDLNQTIPTWRD